jgi:virginiamycin B lyase
VPRQINVPRAAIAAVAGAAVVAGVVLGITRITQNSGAGTAAQGSGPATIASASSGGLGGGIQGHVTRYGVPVSDLGDITDGPDGALWFTASDPGEIGRITTSGSVTMYPLPSPDSAPGGITRGPDGALWFTEVTDTGLEIGRISTSGTISQYVPRSSSASDLVAGGITEGPDGALWFTAPDAGEIGRITTSGSITEYPLSTPSWDPTGITTGPDGALWFAGASGIGRITTAGAIREYPVASANYVATGADGALWFTDQQDDLVGRITTAGSVTTYPMPSVNYPWEITAGPDDALCFTGGPTGLGCISTSGRITTYQVGGQAWGITTGPDGAIWYTSQNASNIGRLS